MKRIGTRLQVMNGLAKQTGGGLKKKDLKYNKRGKIVSKKLSAMAIQSGGFFDTHDIIQDLTSKGYITLNVTPIMSNNYILKINSTIHTNQSMKAGLGTNNYYVIDEEISDCITYIIDGRRKITDADADVANIDRGNLTVHIAKAKLKTTKFNSREYVSERIIRFNINPKSPMLSFSMSFDIYIPQDQKEILDRIRNRILHRIHDRIQYLIRREYIISNITSQFSSKKLNDYILKINSEFHNNLPSRCCWVTTIYYVIDKGISEYIRDILKGKYIITEDVVINIDRNDLREGDVINIDRNDLTINIVEAEIKTTTFNRRTYVSKRIIHFMIKPDYLMSFDIYIPKDQIEI
jgi:hypothetical protein